MEPPSGASESPVPRKFFILLLTFGVWVPYRLAFHPKSAVLVTQLSTCNGIGGVVLPVALGAIVLQENRHQ